MKQPDSYIPFLELNKRQFNPMTVINYDFFFCNWGFFFSQEKSNITTLLATGKQNNNKLYFVKII